jgi:hypothetical protein
LGAIGGFADFDGHGLFDRFCQHLGGKAAAGQQQACSEKKPVFFQKEHSIPRYSKFIRLAAVMVAGAGPDGRGLITPDQFSLPFARKKTNHARPGHARARVHQVPVSSVILLRHPGCALSGCLNHQLQVGLLQ